MPKNRPHKGFLKRFRISKTGMVRHRSAYHKHLSSSKSGKRLRQLRKDRFCANPDAKRFERLLFRRLRGRTQPRAALRRSPNPAQRREMKAARAAARTPVKSAAE
ncbi:MAG: bL35 family ribosomal protein [Phycisphaerales bacterium]